LTRAAGDGVPSKYQEIRSWLGLALRLSRERETEALSSLDFLLSRMDDSQWVATLAATRAFVSKERIRQHSDREWAAYCSMGFTICYELGVQVTPEMSNVVQHYESYLAVDDVHPAITKQGLFEFCLLTAPSSLAGEVLCRLNPDRSAWTDELRRVTFLPSQYGEYDDA
jgi:hypothetical protein